METMSKLVTMKVLIVGLRGLGVETAKNLILAGPRSVTLYDPSIVQWGDLSSNFYTREEHVGKTSRAEASIGKLRELNPNVDVSVRDTLTDEDLKAYNVVCITHIFNNIEHTIKQNEICRANNVGFVLSQTYGPSGFAFVDYGENFVIKDADGEETKSFIVVNVT